MPFNSELVGGVRNTSKWKDLE